MRDLVAEFMAQLEAHIAERINQRLRDALAVSLVAVPRVRGRRRKARAA